MESQSPVWFTPVRGALHYWLFLGFLSFFLVASPPRSVLECCADHSGSLRKQELRAGCHHPCSFSVHSCWGTIHQVNMLEEAQELSELPVWNKSYYWKRTSHTHFFSASLLRQSLRSFSMELEDVGFSATVFHVEEAGNGKECEMWALAENALCSCPCAGWSWRVSSEIQFCHPQASRKKNKKPHTVLAFCNLEQTSTSLYVISNLRIM